MEREEKGVDKNNVVLNRPAAACARVRSALKPSLHCCSPCDALIYEALSDLGGIRKEGRPTEAGRHGSSSW